MKVLRSLLAGALFAAAAALTVLTIVIPGSSTGRPGAPLPAEPEANAPAASEPEPQALPSGGDPTSWCEPAGGGYTCFVGPFDVPRNEGVRVTMPVEPPPEAGYITRAQATLVDVTRSSIPRHMVHFHHAVWLNPNRDDTTCDEFGGYPVNPERFFGSGQERTPMQLPAGHGYHWDNRPSALTGRPSWYFNAHLDGHHGQRNTYVQLRLGFVPEAEAAGITSITPVWLDVRNCQGSATWTVRQGRGNDGVATRRWTFEMPVGGRFVALGGHLHDGGLALHLRNLTTGSTIFTSTARYKGNAPWTLTRMTSFAGVPGKEVRAGHELRLIAVYDSSHTWPKVMGIMLGALAPP